MTPERRAEIEAAFTVGTVSGTAYLSVGDILYRPMTIIRELLDEIDRLTEPPLLDHDPNSHDWSRELLFQAKGKDGKIHLFAYDPTTGSAEERDSNPPVKKSHRFTYDPVTGTPQMERDSSST